MFQHKSLGLDINYILVRIVLLHKDPVSTEGAFSLSEHLIKGEGVRSVSTGTQMT